MCLQWLRCDAVDPGSPHYADQPRQYDTTVQHARLQPAAAVSYWDRWEPSWSALLDLVSLSLRYPGRCRVVTPRHLPRLFYSGQTRDQRPDQRNSRPKQIKEEKALKDFYSLICFGWLFLWCLISRLIWGKCGLVGWFSESCQCNRWFDQIHLDSGALIGSQSLVQFMNVKNMSWAIGSWLYGCRDKFWGVLWRNVLTEDFVNGVKSLTIRKFLSSWDSTTYRERERERSLISSEWVCDVWLADHIDMQLSVRLTGTADFLVTNFTFYDCSVHTSYVLSSFHCCCCCCW